MFVTYLVYTYPYFFFVMCLCEFQRRFLSYLQLFRIILFSSFHTCYPSPPAASSFFIFAKQNTKSLKEFHYVHMLMFIEICVPKDKNLTQHQLQEQNLSYKKTSGISHATHTLNIVLLGSYFVSYFLYIISKDISTYIYQEKCMFIYIGRQVYMCK